MAGSYSPSSDGARSRRKKLVGSNRTRTRPLSSRSPRSRKPKASSLAGQGQGHLQGLPARQLVEVGARVAVEPLAGDERHAVRERQDPGAVAVLEPDAVGGAPDRLARAGAQVLELVVRGEGARGVGRGEARDGASVGVVVAGLGGGDGSAGDADLVGLDVGHGAVAGACDALEPLDHRGGQGARSAAAAASGGHVRPSRAAGPAASGRRPGSPRRSRPRSSRGRSARCGGSAPR